MQNIQQDPRLRLPCKHALPTSTPWIGSPNIDTRACPTTMSWVSMWDDLVSKAPSTPVPVRPSVHVAVLERNLSLNLTRVTTRAKSILPTAITNGHGAIRGAAHVASLSKGNVNLHLCSPRCAAQISRHDGKHILNTTTGSSHSSGEDRPKRSNLIVPY